MKVPRAYLIKYKEPKLPSLKSIIYASFLCMLKFLLSVFLIIWAYGKAKKCSSQKCVCETQTSSYFISCLLSTNAGAFVISPFKMQIDANSKSISLGSCTKFASESVSGACQVQHGTITEMRKRVRMLCSQSKPKQREGINWKMETAQCQQRESRLRLGTTWMVINGDKQHSPMTQSNFSAFFMLVGTCVCVYEGQKCSF